MPIELTRATRITTANAMLLVISQHGRRFFHHEGRVSQFELDGRDRVWFVDKYRGSRIYTHRPHFDGGWGYRFSEGGTLLDLCRELQRFIMGRRADLPLNHLGPWHRDLCGGDLWGYGDSMADVRRRCAALLPPERLGDR